jgi:uncharacterized membrane protein
MISGAHLHLLLNHVPILGSAFALVLLAFGYFMRNDTLSKAALWTLVVVSLIAIPAFLTGEEAEHAVEDRPGISNTQIHEHEEQAEIAFWALMCSGAIALGTLMSSMKTQTVNRTLLILNIAFIVGTFALMARTGNSGGAIRHPEIQLSASSGGQGSGETEHEEEHEHE